MSNNRIDKIYEPKKHFPRKNIIAERFERKKQKEQKERAEKQNAEARIAEVEAIKNGIEKNYELDNESNNNKTQKIEPKTETIPI